MDANTYQELASRTLLEHPDKMPSDLDYAVLWNAMQEAIAAGEFVERLKKAVCHQRKDLISTQQAVTKLTRYGARELEQPPPATEESYMLIWNLLGLIGEASEFADVCLAAIANGHMPDSAKAAGEMGDIQWYINAIATELGISMNDVLEHNVAKLRARYPEGYTAERSSNREGLAE